MKQIKFYGLGGQGVVTAAKALSIASSIYENQYAITIPAYGHERRGAPVYADIMIDDRPVLLNCFVYEPDIVLVMDDGMRDKGVDISAGRKPDTMLVLNTGSEKTAHAYAEAYGFTRVYFADATQIALEESGVGIPNGAMLGLLAKTGLVSIDSVEKGIQDYFSEKAGAKNACVARRAYEAAKTL